MFEDWLEYLKSWRSLSVVGALLLLAALALWQAGGFAAVPRKQLPLAQPGERVLTDDWILRPLSAGVSQVDPANGRPSATGQAWLVLEADVENRAHATQTNVASAIRWRRDPAHADAEPLASNSAILLRDRSAMPALQPGMPERIALAWPIPPGERLNGEQTWVLIGRTWVPQDSLVGAGGWLRPHDVALVRFAVNDPRPPASNAP